MNCQHLVENAKIVEVLVPATDAAGRAGVGFSLKNYRRAIIVVHIVQGNAATILLTPEQCTAVAGTGAKALSQNTRIWANLDTSVNDTLVRATDAKNYTTDAAVKNKIVVFEVDAASLDQANSFDCLRLSTGASNVANLTQAIAYLMDPRYPQATPPSARVD